jgi:tRNA pseudouridine(55) synthase
MSFTRDIADYPDGIVLAVDKPYRWTSADVIRKLKYAAIRHFGKKNLKVGHAGTLDPLATGVLLVCIGNACKRSQQLQDHDKEYIARIRFGATTPSYDLEKEVDRSFPYGHITADAVRAALPAFLGEQEQVAPLFSAKSVDGVRAYELARKLYRSGRVSELDAAALDSLQRNRIHISVGYKSRRDAGDNGRGRSGAKRSGVPPDAVFLSFRNNGVFPHPRGGYVGHGTAGGCHPHRVLQRDLHPGVCAGPGRSPGLRCTPCGPHPLQQRGLSALRRPLSGPGPGPVAIARCIYRHNPLTLHFQ